MSDIAIRVQSLSKQYRIGQRERYKTLRDTLTSVMCAPIRAVASTLNGSRQATSQDLSRNTIWALKDVSFEIKKGEVMGIIGRNGAGKTTLLKILSRITPPTEGYAEVVGRVGSLLEVGTGFHPELTGRENIFLNGAVLGMRKAEIRHKFDEIVSFAEVEKFIDTPVKHFSTGMHTRLAFAVAAHLEPEILLVDEVLAVGDASFQHKCLGKLGDVAHEGRTALLVSHNMGSIKQLCSQSILLEEGQVREMGSTNEVIAQYLGRELKGVAPEHQWGDTNSPGDHTARLKSVRLCSSSGNPRSEFTADEPIYVEVRYVICERVKSFRIGFSLHSSDGTYLFYSSDDDMPGYAGMVREPGEQVSRCQIPSNWLNVGSYYLVVSGDIFGDRSIFYGLPRLSFTVISSGGPTSRFLETRQGVLCPSLEWEIRNHQQRTGGVDASSVENIARG